MAPHRKQPAEGMVFDIETVPQPQTLEMDPPEEFLTRGARSNFKPETLAAHKGRQLERWPAERVKLGSLDWRRGQILSYGIGWWDGDMRVVNVAIVVERIATGVAWQDFFAEVPDDLVVQVSMVASERQLLRQFWADTSLHERPVGFACRDFDCPWLLFRSAANGVFPSKVWQSGRYSATNPRTDLIDLCDLLSWFGKFDLSGWTLDRYCEWFGVDPGPRGSGADIYDLIQAGDHASVVEHQLFDVLATMGLHQKLGWIL